MCTQVGFTHAHLIDKKFLSFFSFAVKTFKIKKSTAATDVEATSPNKSSNIDNNSHSSLPVKQSIAIALASKLNKKNTTSLPGNHDVELPKLVPITSELTCNPFKEQLFNESLHPITFEADHFMPTNDVMLDTTNGLVEDVEESILASAVVSLVFIQAENIKITAFSVGTFFLFKEPGKL